MILRALLNLKEKHGQLHLVGLKFLKVTKLLANESKECRMSLYAIVSLETICTLLMPVPLRQTL